uniref:Uncharacterized protein n=1 Tax=Cacopsylla melanoneura TaxID=428564 RepID=A0A8D8XT86_9HEMI
MIIRDRGFASCTLFQYSMDSYFTRQWPDCRIFNFEILTNGINIWICEYYSILYWNRALARPKSQEPIFCSKKVRRYVRICLFCIYKDTYSILTKLLVLNIKCGRQSFRKIRHNGR